MGDESVGKCLSSGALVGATIVTLAWLLVLDLNKDDYRAKAVANSCAYYAPDTGRFTWGKP